ncbi:GntR family transcriptional regulator [Parasphingorhabdus halotolerans]|uniref:GntR family transcriptional regulator n=1 Tax=Parasphingorhabdus halotolerans TaxID=2725558 RepID=A0A6H2DLD2_9SPHN|nr:GntR family transcriptional regulator [Parasphingorhabdus halotolerans]QJB69482.1 GntR family transcriptional regulator [Parasphingorhabdus halotolerans]
MSGQTQSAVETAAKASKSSKKKPRYLELADELREEVLRGDYPDPGDFPTESVLCKKFRVSRFTVREALRKLASEGLIARKRGSGTVVQPATARAGALHQPLSNVGEILQYARDTTISFEKLDPQEIPVKIAEQIGISPKRKWFVFHGKRLKPGRKRPIAVTVAWVTPELADAVGKIDVDGATLFGQIEELGKLTVTRVTQDIQAIAASRHFARDLGIEENDPVLRILRCYYDETDRLFEISASYHPGERFAYSMHIEVD